MPKEGYSSVTISDELKEKLEKLADKTNRTIPKTIEFLLEECKEA